MSIPSDYPRIIEFYGLPGCGKTTISHMLSKELVNNYSCEVGSLPKYSAFKDYSLLLDYNHWRNLSKLFGFANVFNNKRHPRIVIQPERYVNIYSHFLNAVPEGYLVVDQGIIQGLISISHVDKIIASGDLESFIKSIDNIPILLVYCRCDMSVAKQRMKERFSGGSRLEHLSDADLYHAVQIQQSNFVTINDILKRVCKKVTVVSIDTTSEPEENVNIILPYVLGR